MSLPYFADVPTDPPVRGAGTVHGQGLRTGVDTSRGVNMDHPAVQDLMQQGYTQEAIEAALQAIESAVANGVHPRDMQYSGQIPLDQLTSIYNATANARGAMDADALQKFQDEQSARTMEALWGGMGALAALGGADGKATDTHLGVGLAGLFSFMSAEGARAIGAMDPAERENATRLGESLVALNVAFNTGINRESERNLGDLSPDRTPGRAPERERGTAIA